MENEVKNIRRMSRQRALDEKKEFGHRRADIYSKLPKHNVSRKRKIEKANLRKMVDR